MRDYANINVFFRRYFPLAVYLLSRLMDLVMPSEEVYCAQSSLQKIRIADRAGLRILRFGEGETPIQACISLKNPQRLIMACSHLMLAALYLNPQPKKILILGLGGGVLARSLAQILPQSDITSVEIDPLVAHVAQTYFNFIPNSRQHIVIEDGRKYIDQAQQAGQQYDLIMLDAYDAHYIPDSLMTLEFLQSVKALLTSSGVLAANTFSLSKLYQQESATYTALFGEFYNLKFNNRIILAKKNGLPSLSIIEQNSIHLEGQFKPLGVKSKWLLKLFTTTPDWDSQSLFLRDEASEC
jgi:spermidine synthase